MDYLPRDKKNYPIQSFSPTEITILSVGETSTQIDLTDLIGIKLYSESKFRVKLYGNGDFSLPVFQYGLICGSTIFISENISEGNFYIEVKSETGTIDIQLEKM